MDDEDNGGLDSRTTTFSSPHSLPLPKREKRLEILNGKDQTLYLDVLERTSERTDVVS